MDKDIVSSDVFQEVFYFAVRADGYPDVAAGERALEIPDQDSVLLQSFVKTFAVVAGPGGENEIGLRVTDRESFFH